MQIRGAKRHRRADDPLGRGGRVGGLRLDGASLGLLAAAAIVVAAVAWKPLGSDSSSGGETPAPTTAELTESRQVDAAAEKQVVPRFDVVRISQDGLGVLAGRASANSEIALVSGETVLARTQTNGRGEWTLVLEKGLPPGLAKLSLRSQSGDGARRRSPHTLIAAIPKGEDIPPGGQEGRVLAVLTPQGETGPSRVMQRPGRRASQGRPESPRVDTVDYEPGGSAVISGRAPAHTRLAVALDGRRIGRIASDESGRWQIALEDGLDPGEHVMRVDRLNGAGVIVGQLRQRFAAGRVVDPPPGGRGIALEVKDEIWALVRGLSESELRYTLIFGNAPARLVHPPLFLPEIARRAG